MFCAAVLALNPLSDTPIPCDQTTKLGNPGHNQDIEPNSGKVELAIML